MAGEKVFLTLDQQIDFLINDKGLIIDDHDVAINALQQLGYFSLINGYKDLFRIPLTTKWAQLLKTLFHCTDLMRI